MSQRATRRTVPAARFSVAHSQRTAHETELFESLVDGLSAAMAKAPAEAVDGEIKVWIEKICLALDLDCAAIYERDAQEGKSRVSQVWIRPGLPAFPPRDDPRRWHIEEVDDWLLAGK